MHEQEKFSYSFNLDTRDFSVVQAYLPNVNGCSASSVLVGYKFSAAATMLSMN